MERGLRSARQHDAVPAAGLRPGRRCPLPAARRPRRRRLPPVRRAQDRPRQPDPSRACSPSSSSPSATPATGWSSTPTIPATPASSTEELLPDLEAELPLVAEPHGRALMGASFGAVAVAVGRLPLTRGRTAACSCSRARSPGRDGRCATRRGLAVAAGHRRSSIASVGVAGGGQRAGVRELRRLRVADLREPGPAADAQLDRHGRAVRRDPRRPQLGELARPARRGPALALPGRPEPPSRAARSGWYVAADGARGTR